MAGDEHQAEEVVAHVVVDGRLDRRDAVGASGVELAGELFVLALGEAPGRSKSMARCFAVAISQAPGRSGIPAAGHCSSAATSASCASSSASPRSRTMRVRAAMIRADSMRQTASIARRVSEAASTATDASEP